MEATLKDHALLGLRSVVGMSLAAHGAQKLFGAFGGGGRHGTGNAFEEHLHLEPGELMATLAGSAEFGSGAATALGLGGPIGPTAMISTMAVAALTGHRGKPFFGQMGGPEMPVLYAANAAYFALAGFGRDSIDARIGLRVPKSVALAHAAVSAVVAGAIVTRARRAQARKQAEQEQQEQSEAATPRLRAAGV